MSHFVFGVVEGVPAVSTVKAAAKARHIECKVGAEVTQPVVHEMLAKQFAGQEGIQFLLGVGPEDDTSDLLVSPYVVGIEGTVLGVARCIEWARDIVGCGGGVIVFLTEGYDEEFSDLDPQEALSRIRSEAWIPSIRMRFGSCALPSDTPANQRPALDS